MKTIHNIWLRASVSNKVNLLIASLYIIIVATSLFNLYTITGPVSNTGSTLDDITRCARAQEALQREEQTLRTYLQEPTTDNQKRFEAACVRSKSVLDLLPYNYNEIGGDRFARTRNIRNGYETYAERRDAYTEVVYRTGQAPVQELYALYDILDYLQQYVQVLTQLTVEDGTVAYEASLPMLQSMPYLQILISIVLLIAAITFGRAITSALITPLQKLAHAARKIGSNDFSGEDVQVDNQDEVGEFVTAFNVMKHATEESFNTLRENQKLEEELHREEVERIEIQNRLESTKLDLLQSQINPHFLFNTLNMIAGMAELEDAEVTNRMIRALSNIFRYNLRTAEAFVTLQQELAICEDYIYLQKMRFGERLQYHVEFSGDVSADAITVPVHILQPLVENAVIHGVLKKEEGGFVTVKVSGRENICIRVEDTGQGISEEKLGRMRAELEAADHYHGENLADQIKTVGIGVGNVYRRIHGIYPSGQIEMDSTEGVGTIVTIVFPYKDAEKNEDSDRNDETAKKEK